MILITLFYIKNQETIMISLVSILLILLLTHKIQSNLYLKLNVLF